MSYLNHGQKLGLGLYGSTLINDTVSHVGNWWCVIPYEATVFADLNDSTRDGNSHTGESFPIDYEIHGYITKITLASGAVIAYKNGES